ncbi:MAG: hypothetical protein KJ000_06415 [Pirellulaceae bacterium]|nr:hypothetical protein [Pirellulaceae bacterium]
MMRTDDRPLSGWLTDLATAVAAGLLAAVAVAGVLRAIQNLPPLRLQTWHWAALAVTGTAVVLRVWNAAAFLPAGGLYAFGLVVLGWWWIERGLAPAAIFWWGGSCELAGFALIAAVVGWAVPRVERRLGWVPPPGRDGRWSRSWFDPAQLLLIVATAVLAAWISLDFRFDGVGQGIALFGMAGRATGCVAALMLVGASIVMAWQTHGPWHHVWQYAAMAAGLVFTTSVGWARIDAMGYRIGGESPWLDRAATLMISSAMMTLMTGFGLSRALPADSDWGVRGRRAMPVFGVLALAMLLAVWLHR